jgi:Tfp pilus assembly protein PilN
MGLAFLTNSGLSLSGRIMRLIVHNLLRNAAIKREQRHWRILMVFVYVLVIMISGTTVAYIYSNNLYVARIYEHEIQKIQSDLELLKPKIDLVEKLYNERNNLQAQINLYQQRRNRPEFWLPKLQDCAELLPNPMYLEGISLNINARSGQEILQLKGTLPLDPVKQDMTILYDFKELLENSKSFIYGLARVEILQNRIFRKGNDQNMTFTIGVFEK